MQTPTSLSNSNNDVNIIYTTTHGVAAEAFPAVVFDDRVIGREFIGRVVNRFSPVLAHHILHPPCSTHTSGTGPSNQGHENLSMFCYDDSGRRESGPSESQLTKSARSTGQASTSRESYNKQNGNGNVDKHREDILHRIKYIIRTILVCLAEKLHIRETEVIIGIALIDRAVCRLDEQFIFDISHLPMIMLVSILLGHKMSADVEYKNYSWCSVFGIPARILNESEREFLFALRFNLNVSISEAESIRRFLMSSLEYSG